MKELFEQINYHPGLQYYRALIRHKFSQNILATNAASLRRYITLLESGKIEERSDPQEAKLQWLEQEQILLRKLHNFAAGAVTLIDHTRLLINSSIIRSSHRKRYQCRVDSTFNVPICKFVKKLRNYIVHCGPPQTGQITTINPSKTPEIIISIVLHWESTREWSGWDEGTRIFMDARLPNIRILPLVEEYLTVIAAFHTWFVQDFFDEYNGELTELKELQLKWNKGIEFSTVSNSNA